MSITKNISINKIEIDAENNVTVTEKVVVFENNNQISQSYQNHTIFNGDDYSSESKKVKAVCGAVQS